jgi:hypothetical protein
MRRVLAFVSAVIAVIAVVLLVPVSGDQGGVTRTTTTATTRNYTPPRTAWGDPDLQGLWPGTAMVGVPLQRATEFGNRNVLTDAEFAARQAAASKQSEEDNAEFDIDNVPPEVVAMGTVGGPVSPPPHWLERGEPSRQASLIIDPPDGRMPPLTPEAQARIAARQAARSGRGPADSYEDRSNYDRCITRGLMGSVLPVIYNNGNQIVQTPGYVVIRNEMIHETRIVPLDGRPHVSSSIRTFLGDSRGRWDGNTLVVETTNFTDKTAIGVNGGGNAHSNALRITERFTRVAPDTLQYEATIDDPRTWTRPWTLSFPWKQDPTYGFFEYACHEGNYSLFNILSGHRADEKAAQK